MQEPGHQPMAGVYGKDYESSFSLSGFVQFRENAVKPKAAFGITDTTLDGVALTRIPVHLAFDFSVGHGGFSAAGRWAGKADATLFAKEFIGPRLVELMASTADGQQPNLRK